RGSVSARVQHGRRADPVRKGEVVAEAVGVEEAGRGKGRVALPYAEDLLRVRDARVGDVVLEVDDGFGFAGASRAVEPEGHVVLSRGCGLDVGVGVYLVGSRDDR